MSASRAKPTIKINRPKFKQLTSYTSQLITTDCPMPRAEPMFICLSLNQIKGTVLFFLRVNANTMFLMSSFFVKSFSRLNRTKSDALTSDIVQLIKTRAALINTYNHQVRPIIELITHNWQ